ncbi:MAG: hypothetical protein JW820_00445 [Spirochaetales bacterium]|nr:hypothetical protein [Spirochaetales bacterium]
MPEYLIGVDLGTSTIKAALVDLSIQVVGEGCREVTIRRSGSGRMDQDPGEYLAGTLACIRGVLEEASIDPARVLAVGLDSQMGGIIGIGAGFEALTPYDLVLDTRSQRYSAEIEERCGEAIFGLSSGIWSHAQKILWWKHEAQSLYRRIRKFLTLAAYVGGTMAGLKAEEARIDHTSLFCSGLADIQRRVWSEELCAALDCDLDKLPAVTEPWAVIGGLAEEHARVCGLPAGTPIVAGAGDQPAGFLGAGIVEPGMAIDVAGSTSVFAVCTDQYVPDVEHRKIVTMNSVFPDLYYPLSYVSGGGVVLRWFREQFGPCEPGVDLDQEISTVAPGCESLFFVPHFGGRACPNRPAARGAWVGLSWTHTRIHMYRAILESIAYDHYGAWRRLQALYPGLEILSVRAAGGGARNRVWNQLKSDVLGVPYVEMRRAESATVGSALLAGHAVGAVTDLKGAARRFAVEQERLDPDPNTHRLYEEPARRYERVLSSMEPVWES